MVLGAAGALAAALAFTLGGALYYSTDLKPEPPDNSVTETSKIGVDARDDIFAKLTKQSWCNREATRGSPFPDYADYKFKADGTYEWHFFTDSTPASSGEGKWNFEKNSAGSWLLLYDDGARQRFTLYEDGTLTFEGIDLNPCDPITISNPYTAATLPAIQLPSDAKLVAEKLTLQKWKRANDFDLDYEPTTIEFKKNYEYIATYRGGECQNDGNWYVTANGIVGDSLTNDCDIRDDTYPENLSAKLLKNDFLFLNHDLYTPENYPLEKGVIWSVFGYSDVVSIKVEYDMPIISGIPNKFDVEMTNVGREDYPGPVTLQRFSVTEDYVRNYRQSLTTTSQQVDEIGGIDLGSKILSPGQTYRFSFDVTFPHSGKQSMYINALIDGPTQAWDTHQHYSIEVL